MIPTYFAQIKALLDRFAVSQFVLETQVTFETRPGDQGYLFGSIKFEDGSTLHFKEFLNGAQDGAQEQIEKLTYSYHYQNANDELVFRYDNARHRPPLAFREHKHLPTGDIIDAPAPEVEDVLIEAATLAKWL